MKIKNVLLCGLGAIGGYYASRIKDTNGLTLKILVDKTRLSKYNSTPRIINGKEYRFDYILPDETNFQADLIIIATKSSGLNDAINNIKNFVGENTIILSFLNGITSEEYIKKEYGDKVLYSFLLGHTFFRNGDKIDHDGHANIIFGSTKKNDVRTDVVKEFLDTIKAGYRISDDIKKELWQKFAFNCCVNQLSGITGLTFGEMLNSEKTMDIIKNISLELSQIAKAENVTDNLYNTTVNSLKLMIPDGKTSMLQDIEAGIKPELDIFGKTVIKLGEKHNIDTPYTKIITTLLEIKTENFTR